MSDQKVLLSDGFQVRSELVTHSQYRLAYKKQDRESQWRWYHSVLALLKVHHADVSIFSFLPVPCSATLNRRDLVVWGVFGCFCLCCQSRQVTAESILWGIIQCMELAFHLKKPKPNPNPPPNQHSS